jgi:hypothetical protein
MNHVQFGFVLIQKAGGQSSYITSRFGRLASGRDGRRGAIKSRSRRPDIKAQRGNGGWVSPIRVKKR